MPGMRSIVFTAAGGGAVMAMSMIADDQQAATDPQEVTPIQQPPR